MAKPPRIPVPRANTPRKTSAASASRTTAAKELKHPKLDEARVLAAKGAYTEAAKVLETLTAGLKGP